MSICKLRIHQRTTWGLSAGKLSPLNYQSVITTLAKVDCLIVVQSSSVSDYNQKSNGQGVVC